MIRTATRLLGKRVASSILVQGYHPSTTPGVIRFSSSANIKAQDEAKARIEGIRKELEAIMDKKQQRFEQQGIVDAVARFFSKNKQPLFNMVVSFMGVIFAFQLLGMRRGRDQLEAKLEISTKAVEGKEGILKTVKGLDFAQKVARRVIEETDEPTGWWGRQRLSEEDQLAITARVVQQELEALVGDADLSEENKKKLKLKEFQRLKMQQQGLEEQQLLQLTLGVLSDKPEALIKENMEQTGEDEITVVKKRRIMM